MRVIIKRPGTWPVVEELVDNASTADLSAALQCPAGHGPEQCMTDRGTIVWCISDYLCIKPPPRLAYNFSRHDDHPILGSVVVTGTRNTLNGIECRSLTEAESDRWLFVLTLLAVECEDPIERLERIGALYERLSIDERTLADHLTARLLANGQIAAEHVLEFMRPPPVVEIVEVDYIPEDN
jgi:hypothetical protein